MTGGSIEVLRCGVGDPPTSLTPGTRVRFEEVGQ